MGQTLMRFLKIFCVLIGLLFFVSPFGKKRDPDARKPPVYVAWIGGCFWLIAARLAQAEEHQKKLLAALESRRSSGAEPPREPAEDAPPPASEPSA